MSIWSGIFVGQLPCWIWDLCGTDALLDLARLSYVGSPKFILELFGIFWHCYIVKFMPETIATKSLNIITSIEQIYLGDESRNYL